MLKGNGTLLLIGGVRLASQRSLSIDRKTDMIEVCSPVDGAAKRYVPSTTSWSVSAGGLYATRSGAERLRKMWRAYQSGGETTPLPVSIMTEGIEEQGEAILTSLQETGNVNELVQFSIQLQGSGVLEKVNQRLVFAEGEMNVHMNVGSGHVTFVPDNDDCVMYVDIDERGEWNAVFGQLSGSWCVLPGDHTDWAQALGDLDVHGEMDHASIASGTGLTTPVLPSGRYVLYACNDMVDIDCVMVKN